MGNLKKNLCHDSNHELVIHSCHIEEVVVVPLLRHNWANVHSTRGGPANDIRSSGWVGKVVGWVGCRRHRPYEWRCNGNLKFLLWRIEWFFGTSFFCGFHNLTTLARVLETNNQTPSLHLDMQHQDSTLLKIYHRSGILTGTVYIGVSKNRGTPKWMVYNGKPY